MQIRSIQLERETLLCNWCISETPAKLSHVVLSPEFILVGSEDVINFHLGTRGSLYQPAPEARSYSRNSNVETDTCIYEVWEQVAQIMYGVIARFPPTQ